MVGSDLREMPFQRLETELDVLEAKIRDMNLANAEDEVLDQAVDRRDSLRDERMRRIGQGLVTFRNGKLAEPDPAVTAFLNDLEDLCRKHGMSLSHQDTEGAFVIEDFNPKRLAWLRAANDGRTG